MKLRVSIEAQADMDAIAEFIARDSLAAADQFIDRLTTMFLRPKDNPGIGSPRDQKKAFDGDLADDADQ